jgi:hypothetical protein
MDYGGILKRTWEITWRNKALWILGILASCNGGGRGGAGGGNFSGGNFRGQGLGDAGQAFEQFADNETFWVVVAIAAIVLLGLSLLFLALGVIGQGGLIAAFHKADQGVTLSLAEAFRYGVERFWRMLGLQIIVGLVFLVLFLILLLPILAATVLTLGVALICLLPLLCLLIPLGLTVPIFLQFAQMAIVVEGRGIMDSIRRAWEVIRGNVGPVLVMGLILVVGSFFAQTFFALAGGPGTVVRGILFRRRHGDGRIRPCRVVFLGLPARADRVGRRPSDLRCGGVDPLLLKVD